MSDIIDVSISLSMHIGDDATETDDLSPTEYGIHCRLRRALWRRGGVLDAERSRLRRLVGAETDAEVAALDAVLARLWKPTDDGGIGHPTTLAEIERARAKKASYVARGQLGGRPPAKEKAKPKLGKSSALAEGKAGGKTPPPPPPPSPLPSPSPPPEDLNNDHLLKDDHRPAGGPAGPGGAGGEVQLQLVPPEAGPGPEATKARKAKPDSVQAVYAVYKHYWSHGHSGRRHPSRTSKTWRAIAARLKDGFSVEDLCKAVSGYHLSPFHQGQNETGTKYLDLELFMRSEEKVQKGIDFAENPPKPGSGAKPARDPRIGGTHAEDYVHPDKPGPIDMDAVLRGQS